MAANKVNDTVKGIPDFIRESRAELKKVAWPTKKQVGYSTAAVVVLTCLLGLYLGLVDAALTGIISRLLG